MTDGLHICFFTDQHPDARGRPGVGPAPAHLPGTCGAHRHGSSPRRIPQAAARPPGVVALPALTVARGQYSAVLPSSRLDATVDRALDARGPVDVVHLQGDFWGAWLGKRYAARHGLPLVLTTHTNVDASFRAVAGPVAGLGLRAVTAWQRQVTRKRAAVRSRPRIRLPARARLRRRRRGRTQRPLRRPAPGGRRARHRRHPHGGR